nr:V-type ATP synthase subunit A [Clostridia bacterium]
QTVLHRCMVPEGCFGVAESVREDGEYTVHDELAVVADPRGGRKSLTAAQRRVIRTPAPVKKRLVPSEPLVTGLRVIDTMFPIAKGGSAVIPGGFGTGKTVMQHTLAKWSDADIIIYVGCGERGNEMTQALEEFSELIDPVTHRSMLERTILIANTSNMPVAAREASIYTGITLAEYYRDMGYNAAMMADSTSRWAEALREISGRLEEMPADEGYPAYLPSRLSAFYERAGQAETLGGGRGSVTIIGAVSPPGADFSEPVTQNTKRFTRCFWALDKNLAYSRHYPAINWMESYSEYVGELSGWYAENAAPDFQECRTRISGLLLDEDKLLEVVKLIGQEVLPDESKLVLEICRVIRTGFLQQNTLSNEDAFMPVTMHYRMMKTILYLYDACSEKLSGRIPVSSLTETGIFAKVARMKEDLRGDTGAGFDALKTEIDAALAAVK